MAVTMHKTIMFTVTLKLVPGLIELVSLLASSKLPQMVAMMHKTITFMAMLKT
jgi:hypothetical protein